jgi:hypothetical protein
MTHTVILSEALHRMVQGERRILMLHLKNRACHKLFCRRHQLLQITIPLDRGITRYNARGPAYYD